MTGRAEAFSDDGQFRYRSHGGTLWVAQRQDDGQYDTVRTLTWGASDPESQRYFHQARIHGVNVGDAGQVAHDAREAILQLGDGWRARIEAGDVPEALYGAVVQAVDDPVVFDTVMLLDGTQLYRRDGHAPGWVIVGWSEASRARRYRPTGEPRPFDPQDHDPSL